ncbi:MAG: hypothetical protein P8176_03825 [Gammaproteobacteria bacterium]
MKKQIMKKTVLCSLACVLTCLSSMNRLAHAHSRQDDELGSKVSAALSATWRNDGAELQESGVWQIPGALMGGEAYPVEKGTSLDDANLTIQHNSENGIYGLLQISSHDNGNEAEIHHAYAGYTFFIGDSRLNLEGGRSAAEMTPSNAEHASNRLFSESPLALDVLLGRQLNDEGLRARWQWQDWILGAESWRGSAFPATPGDNGGSFNVFLHHQEQWGRSRWRTGIWWLQADADERLDSRYLSGHTHGSATVTAPEVSFSGRSELVGAFLRLDHTLTSDRQWQLQAEWIQADVDGSLQDSTHQADHIGTHRGAWVQTALRQHQHELGVRWEHLALDNTLIGAGAPSLASIANLYNDREPTRTTFLYAWHATDTFLIRCEWTRDNSQEDSTDRFAVGLVWQETLWSQR